MKGQSLADSQIKSGERPTYTLTGHSFVGDKRMTPIRGDLADIKLAGKLFAPHYAVPMLRTGIAPVTEIHEQPDAQSMPVSALMHGEEFAVLDVAGEWPVSSDLPSMRPSASVTAAPDLSCTWTTWTWQHTAERRARCCCA